VLDYSLSHSIAEDHSEGRNKNDLPSVGHIKGVGLTIDDFEPWHMNQGIVIEASPST